MSFTPIGTQEELDKIINERLSRERESSAKKYEGFLSPDDAAKKYEGYMSPDDIGKLRAEYDTKLSDLNKSLEEANGKITQGAETIAARDKDIADRDAKIKGYETSMLKTRIAQEAGLPYGMSDRLRGENEKEIREDAQSLMKMYGQIHTPPKGAAEPVLIDKNGSRVALQDMVRSINERNKV